MDLIQAHGVAMTEFDRRVREVAPDQWTLGTPCREWSVRDLVGHLVHEQLWAPELLAGCTVDQVGDRFDHDNLGDDPLVSWVVAAAAAREAWLEPSALGRSVSVSSGTMDAEEYCWQMTADLAVHAWDLARSIGADERIDPALASAVLSYVEDNVDDWSGSSMFDSPVPVPPDADDQTRLIGLLGRKP
ncbi:MULTISPECIES: TIGR03086 family metal-binding protein [Lentzea]|uniref:TIGR03086 family protein n=1 Tax=Lentzea albida TaxID=65499 RepID=A0A1H9GGF3_9PSEU|nr:MULTISPECIES: TIGR03086 family metal-binding protein [Lentzea]USX52419.1 TIGR03086 family metal-binding protein [Lentzea sp. HUAS12]SEQ49174.1 TIGR03086 family protein [Lentzea albida]